MPTFNRCSILQESIQAIENQTVSKDDFELIVVDDGSEDGTVEFLAEYQGRTGLNFRYLSQPHAGPATARNLGIIQSSGEISILLGDDMLAFPTLVDDHLHFHRNYPELSHGCLGFIDWAEGIEVNGLMRHVTSKKGGQQFNYTNVESQDPDNVSWNAFWSGNVSFKKTFALTHGLFDSDTFRHALWEDIELGYRLHRAGLLLHFRKECKVGHKHVLTLEGFADRQRLVGWYLPELERLGVPVKGWRANYGNKGYWSKEVLRQTTESLSVVARNAVVENDGIPAEVYNTWLNYAVRVGYAEREKVLRGGENAVMAHLYNLSLAEEKIESLEEENQRLRGEAQEAQKNAEFANAVRRTWAYRIYRKFVRPFIKCA